MSDTPFDPAAEAAYRRWREQKLAGYREVLDDLVVEFRNPAALSKGELEAIRARCRKTNMAIYAVRGARALTKDAVRRLAQQLGLHRLDRNLCADDDAITPLQVVPGGRRGEYIPYTDRPINWHTDGYYNAPRQYIRALLLHCVSAAARGGENALLDHELAYLLMRDEDPAYVAALMAPDAMTIPANVEHGVELRPERRGPVFSLDPAGGALHMRYTARTRSIRWRQDEVTREAVRFLERLLAGGTPYTVSHRLEPGQGIVCNNVLHKRAAFRDDPATGRRRLLYRARFYDRIPGT